MNIIEDIYKFVQNILNMLIAYCFVWLAEFTLKHNKIKERNTAFYYIVILEIFNMGFIFMFIAYDPTGFTQWFLNNDEQGASFKNGFNKEWYEKVGK